MPKSKTKLTNKPEHIAFPWWLREETTLDPDPTRNGSDITYLTIMGSSDVSPRGKAVIGQKIYGRPTRRQRANVEFIIRAVNNFADLLNQLQVAHDEIDFLYAGEKGKKYRDLDKLSAIRAVIDEARK